MRILIGLLMISAPALASSTAAWNAHDAAARGVCVKAAGLAAPITASAPVIFSDDAGAKTAILVTGRYRQSFMHGAKGEMLCLYDRRTKRAEVQEAKRWSAPK